MKALWLVVFFTLAVLFVQGQNYLRNGIDRNEDVPTGLAAGSMAPDFSGTNRHGDTVRLYDALKTGNVVLIFYRGYWCGVCNRYLQQYQDSLKLITAKGARIIAITPELEKGVANTVEKTGATFDIISDHNNAIMEQYKVDFKVTSSYQTLTKLFTGAGIGENNGQQEARLPVPATYIINRHGRITYVQFDLNYKYRASVKEILQNL